MWCVSSSVGAFKSHVGGEYRIMHGVGRKTIIVGHKGHKGPKTCLLNTSAVSATKLQCFYCINPRITKDPSNTLLHYHLIIALNQLTVHCNNIYIYRNMYCTLPSQLVLHLKSFSWHQNKTIIEPYLSH